MLAIQKAKGADEKCCPNILPCRVHHDGPVNASARYWNPKTDDDGSRTSYFRGRRLRGTAVKIPSGFKGVVLEKTDRVVTQNESPQSGNDGVDADEDADGENIDEEDGSPCIAMDQVASFDELVVWGHEALPNGLEDPYCKGIDEWVKFAQAMHSFKQDHVEEAQAWK